MMKLGVISNGVSLDVQAAAKAARAAGLEGIEFQFIWDCQVGDEALTEPRQQEAKQIVADNGLAVSCVSRFLFSSLPLTTEVASPEYQAEFDALRRCIAFAKLLGCDKVRTMSFRKETVFFGGGGAEHWIVSTGAWDRLLNLLAPAVALAKEEGVTLVVETGTGNSINSAQLAVRLVDEMPGNEDRVMKALWDPCNSLYSGEKPCPDACDVLAGGYVGHVHIKDVVARPAQSTADFCRLGAGDMAGHLQGIADFLRKENYTGAISFESTYRPEGKDFGDGFAESIELFKQIYG